MSDMLVVKVRGEGDYELDVEQTMADLTGSETLELEEFLGGWDKFDLTGATTRSIVVLVWLAKRAAGKKASLEEILDMRGLVFGDAIELEEAKEGPPAEAPDSGHSSSSSESTSDLYGAGGSSSATA